MGRVVVMGVDATLTGTGIVVLGDKGELVYTCRIDTRLKGVSRLVEIRDTVARLIKNHKPALVCLEGYSFGSKGRALFQTGELGGVLRVMFHELGAKWIEVSPSQLKKFATGSGNSKKEVVILNVYKRWGMEFESNDEADAFVLAQIGTAILGHSETTNKKQEEVVKTLRGG